MRILSYNIHKGIGNDRRYQLDRVLDVVLAEEADVVCLQEVDTNVRRSGLDDQPTILSREFGAVGNAFQLNVPVQNGGYGNLLLARWPLRDSFDVCLRYGRAKPRAALVGIVEAPDGPVCIVNWHLGLRERERHWQVRRLLTHEEFRHRSIGLPIVVVGDFNDWRDNLHAHFLVHGFRQVTNPSEGFRSFPSFLPVTSLDKAFERGLTDVTARVVRTPQARRASDHLPLVVESRSSSGVEVSAESTAAVASS